MLTEDAAGDEIGFADELRNHPVDRIPIDFDRRADLYQLALIHHRQPVRHRQRFLLIVRHIDGGQPERLADPPDLRPHFEAKPGIEVGQRLVEQQTSRPHDQRARQRHTLLLPAGELLNPAIAEPPQLHGVERLLDAHEDLLPWPLLLLQPERHVLRHGQMRPERITLEHHAGATAMRRHPRDVIPIEQDCSVVRLIEPGDVAEQCGLAATARPEQKEQFAVPDGQIDLVQYGCRTEALRQVPDDDHHHGSVLPGNAGIQTHATARTRCGFLRRWSRRLRTRSARREPLDRAPIRGCDRPVPSSSSTAEPACPPHAAGLPA